MRGGFKSLFLRYGSSILTLAAVIGLAAALRSYGLRLNFTLPVIIVVVAMAWFAGRGPSILLSVLLTIVSAISAWPTNTLSVAAFYFQYASVLALLMLVVLLVSGRRDAQEKARSHGDLFRTTLASIGDAVVTTDASGSVTFVNPIAERIVGVSADELVGMHLRDVYRLSDDGSGEPIPDVFETIRKQKEIITFTSNIMLHRPDGTSIAVRDSGAPIIDSKGSFCGAVIVFQDDTARRAAEQALIEAEHRQQLSQKLEAIGTLTGGVAHDFNNLLTAILGYTQLAMRKIDPSSPAQASLVNVEKAGNRAAELTKKLLAFGRQQKLERRVIDLNEAIGEMLRLLERVIGEEIEVSFKTTSNLDAVYADPTQIEQVVMNLSLNARDAMPKGGRLMIETRNVALDEYYCRQYPTCVPGDYVQILVSDNGHGMDQSVLDRMFEPFFTTKSLNEGTGLGLSMVYGIVKQHKGHINVYSEPGQGTTFKIYLPVVPDGAVKEDRIAQAALAGGSETILVADDEEALRRLSRDVLEALGYTVITAENGERAVELFSDAADSIDLLLLDVVMPVCGGVTAYEKIVDLGGKVPAIFMTGYSSEVLDASNGNHGKFDSLPIIQKPYTLDGLGRVVRKTLDEGNSV